MNGTLSSEMQFSTEANASGIYWAAVIAGAFVTAALWLTLTLLGVGLGLSAISPWVSRSASSKTIEVGAITWLIVSQIIASGLGGYLAGRWRIKWPTVHTDEVYFRDTAHGFLVWAVAVVASAAFLGTALSAIMGTDVKYAPTYAPTPSAGLYQAPSATVTTQPGTTRQMTPGMTGQTAPSVTIPTTPGGTSPQTPGETSPTTPGTTGQTTPGVTGQTTPGSSTPTAPSKEMTTPSGDETTPGASEKSNLKTPPMPGMQTTQATPTKQDLEEARRAGAKTAIWMFVALLIGAFCASLAATFGGKQRDNLTYYDIERQRPAEPVVVVKD